MSILVISPYQSYSSAFENKPIERTLNWLQDYGEALKTAVEKQRPVWLQFTGPWCPNCHRMDRESFKHPGVIDQLSKHFIPAKISCDDNAELALSFGFTQLPATVLISPDGKILAKHEGFADPEQLNKLSNQAGIVSNIKHDEPLKSLVGPELLANENAPRVPDAKPASETPDSEKVAVTELAQDDSKKPLNSTPTNELDSSPTAKPDSSPTTAIALAPPVPEAAELLVDNSSTYHIEAEQPLLEKPLEPLGKLCPVTLLDQKMEAPADASITAVYAGQRYYFANQTAKSAFAKNPERYVPARGGECIVSFVEEKQERIGSSQFPVIYDDRIFLCAGEQQRANFISNPAQYADKDVRLAGLCPHCAAAQQAQSKKGSSLFQIRFGGSRYLFPDKEHMEAFLKSPLRYLR